MPPPKQGGRKDSRAARRQAAEKESLRAQRERSRSQGEPALAVGVTGGFAGTDEDGEEQRQDQPSEGRERQGRQRDARAGEPRLLCPSPSPPSLLLAAAELIVLSGSEEKTEGPQVLCAVLLAVLCLSCRVVVSWLVASVGGVRLAVSWLVVFG